MNNYLNAKQIQIQPVEQKSQTINPINDIEKMRLQCVMVSPKEVARMLGVSTVTLWRWEGKNAFPKRSPLSNSRLSRKGWRLVDIQSWLESRSTDSRAPLGIGARND